MGGGIVFMIYYIMTQFGGTRLEALLYGRWYKQLISIRDIRIFMYINTDLFRAVVDSLNNKRYHVS